VVPSHDDGEGHRSLDQGLVERISELLGDQIDGTDAHSQGIRVQELTDHNAALSGGERARFCLARALLLQPKVLVLDETTASLEASEQALMAAVAKLAGTTTVITISHRESTLAACDRQLVLGN